MNSPPAIVLIGLGGYGSLYLDELLQSNRKGPDYRLVGIVEPSPPSGPALQTARERGIPIFAATQDFYRAAAADLAVIATPLHLHAQQTVAALQNGSHVLCEKPAAAATDDVSAMCRARDAAAKTAAVGFQWVYSDALQLVLEDCKKGLLGRPRTFKAFNCWPRPAGYYTRNTWAGRISTAQGALIFDSPASNAFAHDLHCMLHILYEGCGDRPATMEAERYRAYEIENFDTVAARIRSTGGITILFYASHASERKDGPNFVWDFEDARVTWTGIHGDLCAVFSNGTHKNYGKPQRKEFRKLYHAIGSVSSGTPPLCSLESARQHTVCVDAMQRLPERMCTFPDSLIEHQRREDVHRVWVRGLDAALRSCFERGILPSEAGISWSRPAMNQTMP